MQWVGLGLAIAGAIVALVAGFKYHDIAWTVGGGVFCVIGIITLVKSHD